MGGVSEKGEDNASAKQRDNNRKAIENHLGSFAATTHKPSCCSVPASGSQTEESLDKRCVTLVCLGKHGWRVRLGIEFPDGAERGAGGQGQTGKRKLLQALRTVSTLQAENT